MENNDNQGDVVEFARQVRRSAQQSNAASTSTTMDELNIDKTGVVDKRGHARPITVESANIPWPSS